MAPLTLTGRWTDTAWYRHPDTGSIMVAGVSEVEDAPEFHQEAGWWWHVRKVPANMLVKAAGWTATREEAVEAANAALREHYGIVAEWKGSLDEVHRQPKQVAAK